MERKEFGYVTVWVDENNIFTEGPRVEVNWSCIGSVPVDKAQHFAKDLAAAIDYATAEEIRLGIRTIPADIVGYCRARYEGGDKIGAIKEYRTRTGCSLKEAVEAVRDV